MVFKYRDREMFHGNERLLIAKLDSATKFSDVVYGTGLVSVSAMEDEAEVTNFPADNVPDHATISGAQLLKGTLKFLQLDPDVRVKFFGQETTTNGYGYASTGASTPARLVQYVSLGSKRDGTPKMRVMVYPNISVIGKPKSETETDSSDTPVAIQWEASVQASGSEFYTTSKGNKAAEFEYFFEGADVQKVKDYIDAGGVILPNYDPDTTKVGTTAGTPAGG